MPSLSDRAPLDQATIRELQREFQLQKSAFLGDAYPSARQRIDKVAYAPIGQQALFALKQLPKNLLAKFR